MIGFVVFIVVYAGFGVWCVKHFAKPGSSLRRRLWVGSSSPTSLPSY